MRYRADDSVQRFGPDGRVVLGGDPVSLLRLSPTGAAALDRTLSGATPAGGGEAALVERLVDRGVLVP